MLCMPDNRQSRYTGAGSVLSRRAVTVSQNAVRSNEGSGALDFKQRGRTLSGPQVCRRQLLQDSEECLPCTAGPSVPGESCFGWGHTSHGLALAARLDRW